MASGIKVKLNHSGMGALLKSSEVRNELTSRDGLHIVQDTTDRAVVRVAGSTDHDWIVEHRTGNLARALDAGR
jgi:hypothetical protein